MIRRKKVSVIIISFISLFFFVLIQYSAITPLTNSSNIASAFSFSLENGFYEDDIQVELLLTPTYSDQLQIHYTLDGSTPDASSPVYTTPFAYHADDEIQSVTIKAILCNQQLEVVGGPYTATYFLKKNIAVWSNALVVSITTDADGLFSPENGILYPMSDCGPSEEDWSWFKKQNCKQRGEDWIRNAHIDIFEPDGTNVISQNIGLCVDGDHGSMTHYPYSLKVLAGKEYDSAHPSFTYDIFRYYNTKGTPFPHIQDFNNMVFRNGGNEYNAGIAKPDQKGTMLRWNIGSRLADEAGYMTAGARPAILFLNGELYAVTQLQDTYNRYNTAAKTRLNKDSLQIWKDSELACTQYGGYQDLYYSYPDLTASPILLSENQEELEDMVSIDDMFSYYAFEVLVNNTDYPKKNYAIWRYNDTPQEASYADGKFRFLINDLDCTWDFRYDDDLWTAYFDKVKEDGVLMASLIQVEQYRDRYLNTLCDLMNSGLFDPDHLDTVINEANNAFQLIASYYYTPKDEAKRQQNVLLLKESAFARKGEVRNFIQETFHPASPYTLQVKSPAAGTSIRFSTTELTSLDGDFQGEYYGDYPMTLSCTTNDYTSFVCWKINGKTVASPEVRLDATLICDDRITVELITTCSDTNSGLLISEIYTGPDGPWIELYNASDKKLQLDSYSLSNKMPSPFLKFHLPSGTLAPGETFVAGIDNTGLFRLEQGIPVYLTTGRMITDSVLIPVMAERESYGRFGETNEWRYYINPTKGTLN